MRAGGSRSVTALPVRSKNSPALHTAEQSASAITVDPAHSSMTAPSNGDSMPGGASSGEPTASWIQ